MKFKKSIFELLLMFAGGCALLFIVAPIAGMFLHCDSDGLSQAATDSEVLGSIWLTLWTAMAATLILSLLAVPLAYILARKEFPFKRFVTGIIDIPVVIPHSAAGIAILGVLAGDSLLGGLAEDAGFSFVGSWVAIAAAMAFVSVPFLVNGAREGFSAVPLRYEKTALSLGASPARVFFTISIPLAWRSILAGMIMMWARGLSEFGAVVIVAYHPMITPVLIYERFGSFGLKYARPVAVLFVTICLFIFFCLRMLAGKGSNAEDK